MKFLEFFFFPIRAVYNFVAGYNDTKTLSTQYTNTDLFVIRVNGRVEMTLNKIKYCEIWQFIICPNTFS